MKNISEDKMDIREKIEYISSSLNINFAIKNYIKIEQLEKEVRRYLKRELNNEKNIRFDSSDLRQLCMSLEKVHKSLNKKISFVEFQKKFNKYDKITGKELWEETKKLAHYLLAVKEIQKMVSVFNYHATVCYLIELQHERIKKEDDYALEHAIYEALVDSSNL
ncbi:MAG: hypothetical protein MJ211_10190 [Bacteroidales bacterium]|nr:hypothetical protein [Bacteroidales bacterium]